MLRLLVGHQRVVVVVIPMGTQADVEVAHVEIEQCQFQGVLIVGEGMGVVTVFVEVDIVAAEDVGQRGLEGSGGV